MAFVTEKKKKYSEVFNSKQFKSLEGFVTVHIINLKRLRTLSGPQWLKVEEMPQSNYKYVLEEHSHESTGSAG